MHNNVVRQTLQIALGQKLPTPPNQLQGHAKILPVSRYRSHDHHCNDAIASNLFMAVLPLPCPLLYLNIYISCICNMELVQKIVLPIKSIFDIQELRPEFNSSLR